MTVDAITGVQQTVNQQAARSLSDNFDTFLSLLTAQLQNQDPLSPMDSTQFTQQLVQFSQVEQQIRTNENLESLITQNTAAAAALPLSYLGKAALIDSPNTFLPADGSAQWTYVLDQTPAAVTLNVRDSAGRIVFSADGPAASGSRVFSWDGLRGDGSAAPPGVYTLTVNARNAEGATLPSEVNVLEIVSGVDMSGATPRIVTQSGTHDLDDVLGILNP
ncbi:MAG: flagellar hook assembly protein FlgD [Hyphomonadaceae bacterium]